MMGAKVGAKMRIGRRPGMVLDVPFVLSEHAQPYA